MLTHPEHLRAISAAQLPTSAITEQIITDWAYPRFGDANPTRMDNPLWEWLIRTRISAYGAEEKFQLTSRCSDCARSPSPYWCFDRLGRASVRLADGRLIQIGGEHEDHYHPDFYIYNDVVVWHPDGRIEIYGYPREIFPPTDSHTATLVGDRIILIGNRGYPSDRRSSQTQLVVLNLSDFSMEIPTPRNAGPGWIFGHKAHWDEQSGTILITAGQREQADKGSALDNFDEWQLDPNTWTWRCTKTCDWRQFSIHRVDGKCLHCWEFSNYLDYIRFANLPDDLMPDTAPVAKITGPDIEQEAGIHTDYWIASATESYQTLQKNKVMIDVGLMRSLYWPNLPEVLPEPQNEGTCESPQDEATKAYFAVFPEDEPNGDLQEQCVRVQGVRVRYRDTMTHEIILTVEGELPESVLQALVQDLQGKLAKLENAECRTESLQ